MNVFKRVVIRKRVIRKTRQEKLRSQGCVLSILYLAGYLFSFPIQFLNAIGEVFWPRTYR